MIVFNEQEKTLIYKDKELTDCIKASDMSPLFRLYVEIKGLGNEKYRSNLKGYEVCWAPKK